MADMAVKDCLLALGEGMGTLGVVGDLLNVLATISKVKNPAKRSLIVLLNADGGESGYLSEHLLQLNGFDPNALNFRDTSDITTIDKRRQLYYQGGVISVPNRVFVADLLNKVVDANVITGLVILHAERIGEFSSERFIIQLYRKHNKWGFLKTVSDRPERLMKSRLRDNLRFSLLDQVLIWPRFHRDVKSSIVKSSQILDTEGINKVIEIRVEMTQLMTKIQNGLMSSIEQLLSELKRNVNKYSQDDWDLDHCLNPNFVQSIRNSLTKYWHLINASSKKLLNELTFLINLLKSLFIDDCITFNGKIQDYFKSVRDNPFDKSFWQLTDHFGTVLTCAQSRVRKKDITNQFVNILEDLPKWDQLGLILNEISQKDVNGPIVIACKDYMMVNQLKNVISKMKPIKEDGETVSFNHLKFLRMMLFVNNQFKIERELTNQMNINVEKEERSLNNLLGETLQPSGSEMVVSRTFQGRGNHTSERRRTRGGAIMAQRDKLLSRKSDLIQELVDDQSVVIDLTDQPSDSDSFDADFEGALSRNYHIHGNDEGVEIIIGTFDELQLDELLPSNIIIYQPNLEFIRKVEIYQSSLRPSRCYFMIYSSSCEEQIYLNDVKNERDSMIKLIKEKSQMPKYFFEPEDELAKYKHHEKAINTRIAGGGKTHLDLKKNVIVDIRELRAKLPFMLYLNEMEITPVQLTIGDYIISQDICIERKSIPDLRSSLEKGRLFDQCVKMFQFYKTPVLLIEFDDSTSFTFEQIKVGFYMETQGKTPDDGSYQIKKIQRDLMTLVKEFPQLRIIWSSSPLESAKIIKNIKQRLEEPDLEMAIKAGTLDQLGGKVEYNEDAINMLKLIPGVNDSNASTIMSKYNSIKELSLIDMNTLQDLLGEINGKLVYKFFHDKVVSRN